MTPIRPAFRVPLLIVASIAGGALVGLIAAAIMVPFAAFFGVIGGGIVGLLVSPVLAIALGRKPMARAMLLVLVPSIVAAVLGGLAKHPGVALLSVPVFVCMAFIAAVILPDLRFTIDLRRCATCGYDRGDLPRCPECGEIPVPSSARPSSIPVSLPTHWTARRRIQLALALIPVLAALSLLAHAAWNRNRTRTTPELITQLGDNDMELQWEASHELARRRPIPLLIQALHNPNPTVRRNAARTLELSPAPEARPDLEQLLSDPDSFVREFAKRALDRLPPG